MMLLLARNIDTSLMLRKLIDSLAAQRNQNECMYIWRTKAVWPASWSSLSEQWRGLWWCAEGGWELKQKKCPLLLRCLGKCREHTCHKIAYLHRVKLAFQLKMLACLKWLSSVFKEQEVHNTTSNSPYCIRNPQVVWSWFNITLQILVSFLKNVFVFVHRYL